VDNGVLKLKLIFPKGGYEVCSVTGRLEHTESVVQPTRSVYFWSGILFLPNLK